MSYPGRCGVRTQPDELESDAHRPGSGASASTYVNNQPFSASSTFLFAIVPGAGTATNRPELFAHARPDNGETQTEQAQENRLSRQLRERAAGLCHPGAARRRQSARGQAHRARTRRTARHDRGRRAAGERDARPERSRAGVHSCRGARAARRVVGRLPDRHAPVAPLRSMAAVAARVDAGRPVSAHPRPRRPRRGGEGARRRVQPHARPAHRRVRRPTRVRRRRLARAAHAADRDPRSAGSARRAAGSRGRGGASCRAPGAVGDRAYQPARGRSAAAGQGRADAVPAHRADRARRLRAGALGWHEPAAHSAGSSSTPSLAARCERTQTGSHRRCAT